MCGIAGHLAPDRKASGDKETVARICEHLVHRGPDDYGLVQDGPMALGHRRLSIIDLSSRAAQPLSNEDETIQLAINGEIYNFELLREELEEQGHVFKTDSDSEVALHLYEQEGIDFLSRLRGMYALALWDGCKKRLVLARDRFGKKPLYYHVGPKGIHFASEAQALIESGNFDKEADLEAIDAYLALQYVPTHLCAFKGVKKLPPGAYLDCRPGSTPEPKRYHRLKFEVRRDLPLSQAAHELRKLIEEAVRVRMISDVPLGAFLSGGIDSSLVVACMATQSRLPVKTFSIGFPSKDHSELTYARRVSRLYDTDHHEMVVDPDMVSIVPRLVRHYGEPYADTSAVPTWYLSRFTKQHVTVALSGDAGDEGFGGYTRYRYARIARMLLALPKPLPRWIHELLSRLPIHQLQPVRDFGRRLLESEATRYLGLIAHFPHDDRMQIYTPDMQKRFGRDLIAADFETRLRESPADAVGKLMDLDIQTYLPDDILVKVDIASMAHALEVRCPLLDQEVMSLAASLPSDMKLRRLTGKIVLKKAVQDLLPSEITERRKRGFALPIDRWVREDLWQLVNDMLLDTRARQRGIFDIPAVEKLLDLHRRGESRGLQIWNLLMLEHWYRTFID